MRVRIRCKEFIYFVTIVSQHIHENPLTSPSCDLHILNRQAYRIKAFKASWQTCSSRLVLNKDEKFSEVVVVRVVWSIANKNNQEKVCKNRIKIVHQFANCQVQIHYIIQTDCITLHYKCDLTKKLFVYFFSNFSLLESIKNVIFKNEETRR